MCRLSTGIGSSPSAAGTALSPYQPALNAGGAGATVTAVAVRKLGKSTLLTHVTAHRGPWLTSVASAATFGHASPSVHTQHAITELISITDATELAPLDRASYRKIKKYTAWQLEV